MDEDMVTRFSKFQLNGKEDAGIDIVIGDISQCKQNCERSLLCQIWGYKTANFTGLKNTLGQIWCPNGDLRVIERSSNFYQLVFSNQEEENRVLLRQPWFFDNQILILQPWKPNLTAKDPIFKRAQLWIHVKGLPYHWSSKEVGWKLGKLFFACLNVVLPETGNKEGKMLKLLVEINLDLPLLRGTKIKLGEEWVWVEFSYEQVPTFCFYCGIIGHPERICTKNIEDARENKVCEGQYGDWLRASVNRRGRRGEMSENTVLKRAELLVAQCPNESGNSEQREAGDKDKETGTSSTQQLTKLALVSEKPGNLPGEEFQTLPPAVVASLTKDVLMNDLLAMRNLGEAEQGKDILEPENDFLSARQAVFESDEENLESASKKQSDQAGLRVLQELDPNSMMPGISVKEEGKRSAAGKWKRLARQKGKEAEEGSVIRNVNSTTSGHKRDWQLTDSDTPKLQGLGQVKRQKGPQQENVISMQVEEASLNWPQLDQ